MDPLRAEHDAHGGEQLLPQSVRVASAGGQGGSGVVRGLRDRARGNRLSPCHGRQGGGHARGEPAPGRLTRKRGG